MAKQAYIIAGPNGSGKTTFAKEWIGKEKIPFLNADEIAYRLAPDGNFESVRIQAGKQFLREFETLVHTGNSFAVETTLAGRYFTKNIERLKSSGYDLFLLFVFVESIHEAKNRIRLRVEKGGHNISDEDVERRFSRSIRNFWHMYRFMADQWQLVLNGEDEFSFIAEGAGNEYNVLNEQAFSQFYEVAGI